jgi:hypothetical protein
MKFIKYLLAFIFICQVKPNMAQIPDYYKEVDRVVWIVNDLQSVMNGWQSLGFTNMMDHGLVTMWNQPSGNLNVYMASANFGGARITWIQPDSKNNLFSEFLSQGGDGAFSLMHRVPSFEVMQEELQRLKNLDIKPLMEGSVSTDDGPVNYVFLDTQHGGKYVLGLITGQDDMADFDGDNQLGMKFTQFAFAIDDPDPVSLFWAGLGFPPLEITHGETWGKEYYGKSADFDMKLGWQRHGNIVYEWCIPLKGPTVYADHIRTHGEGIQHFGFNVQDMDQAIAFFKDQGYDISMSGGWGEKGKPGSGRFAYVDTEKVGGETIELLWSYR